jgi:2-C-methyl-D-erythritol 4-phosphate cytidylyltransferase
VFYIPGVFLFVGISFMKKYAVIVAGGSGLRMGTAVPKQFLPLQGKPVLWHTLTAFLTAFNDLKIILVQPEQYFETGYSIIAATADPQRIQLTAGGETRYHSVKNGLRSVPENAVVFVHDGVRCLVTPALIKRCYETALEKGNAVPATGAVDSLRIETGNDNEVLDRANVRIIQTSFTDEAMVVEKLGVKINLVEGEAANIKITNPVDLFIAEKILAERSSRV